MSFNFNEINVEPPFSKSFVMRMLNPNPDLRVGPEKITAENIINCDFENDPNPEVKSIYESSLRSDEIKEMYHCIGQILRDDKLLDL
jgi:hypothetical protein